MKRTYNQIIEVFKDIADKHYNISGFVNNHPLTVNDDELEFPLMAIYPAQTRVIKHGMIIPFKIFVMDLQTNGAKNESEILSDTLQTCNDIIKILYQNEEKFGFVIDESNVILEPFAENFSTSEGTRIEDDVAGWFMTLEVQVQNDFDYCDLPINIDFNDQE